MRIADRIMVGPCDICGEPSLFATTLRNDWFSSLILKLTQRYGAQGENRTDLVCCTCGCTHGNDLGSLRDADGEMITKKFSDILVEGDRKFCQ